MDLPSEQEAREFLHKYVDNEYQRHHSEMVAVAMQTVAKKIGENEAKFFLTGLIHDWDYDKWPEEHPGRYEQLQTELGVDQEIIEAIKGHADLNHPRITKLAQALLATDEFSGLLYAYNKMVGSYGAMKTSSIKKKLHKELAFAAKINREDITTGIEELGIPENEYIELIRDAFAEAYD